jgi:hypothetical protein
VTEQEIIDHVADTLIGELYVGARVKRFNEVSKKWMHGTITAPEGRPGYWRVLIADLDLVYHFSHLVLDS